MKKIILGLIFIGVIIGGYQLINFEKEKNNDKTIERVDENDVPLELEKEFENNKGYLANDFTLVDLNGKEFTLSSLRGKNVMLNFWATWCPPCKAEMPDIEKLYNESKNDDDFEIIAVNVGENPESVKKFIKENNYNFKILLDTTTEVSLSYGAFALPTTLYIDKEGYVKREVRGAMNYSLMKELKKNLVEGKL